ncbi:hypothetical protein DFJ77DRAFT_187149 [Powellomyces hirtus]|nr:hypothetical protein DFJ77DRAFT_187149 [Powellomyces hirtus]
MTVSTPLATLRKSENWSLMKVNAFRLRQRSEDLLIQRMRAYFSPKLMVVLGDWQSEARARHKKFHAPTKVAGFRKLFNKHHIPCFLIDEFRTSSFCPHCHTRLSRNVLPKRPSARPWREHILEEVYGLLGCAECAAAGWPPSPRTGLPYLYWNRDMASVRNFDLIVRSMIDGNGRPAHLSRSESESE